MPRTQESKRLLKERRMAEAKALLGGHCVLCLPHISTQNLEFDHMNPSTKLFAISQGAYRVSEQNFWLEVAKCQLLCFFHHVEKSKTDGSRPRGVRNGRSKLTILDVETIRNLIACGLSNRSIANEFGVSKTTVSNIRLNKSWQFLTHQPGQ